MEKEPDPDLEKEEVQETLVETTSSGKNGKKLRICIPTFFYKPAGGGVPRYVENVARALGAEGHKVDIITAAYEKRKVERDSNITIYRLPCMNIFRKTPEENKKKSMEFLKFLEKYMKKKPDIIAAQNFHAIINSLGHLFALNMITLKNKVPTILTVHSFIQENENANLKLELIKNMPWNKIIAVGSNLAEDLFNKGIPSEDIKIVNPPVDTEKFKPVSTKKWLRSRIDVSEKDFLILHASRIDGQRAAEEKGVFTLLKALSLIKEKEVKLLIAGAPTTPTFEDSKEKTIIKIKETAKLLGIENRVIIHTFDPEEMNLVYNGADLFVMASQMESFGLVYAEALSCEIPVIGTTVGGIPEVIEDGKSGELVSPDNHVELSKVIRKSIKNIKKLKKMGVYGRKSIVDKIEIKKVCRNLAGIYESVIKQNS